MYFSPKFKFLNSFFTQFLPSKFFKIIPMSFQNSLNLKVIVIISIGPRGFEHYELMLPFVYTVSDGGGGSNVERDLTQDAWSSSDEDD